MSGRTFFVGGNWKCNGAVEFNKNLIAELNAGDITSGVDVVIAPPALFLTGVAAQVRKEISVSAQNCIQQSKGAFTGEISAEQIKDIGLSYVILGHSERRSIYGESDEVIGLKIAHAQEVGLNVIACLGEKLEDREGGKTEAVIGAQLKSIAASVKDWSKTVLAYEPVWAIGTGVTASPEQAQDAHKFLRGWLADNVSAEVAAATRIIYGGSVNPKNCDVLSTQPDLDGFLVGGCSLKGPDFLTIIAASKNSN
eukprot:TRINITY_DN11040_c0_g1_i1.p1 TRINITY_DN11040_c0_g1~~TRINITY_DN11040_c0_g1_i1.p1  ORF type:complete len:269 (+),score=80.62 TRINITY_DN11040_c0_g1_i1:49-807(+)